MLNGRATHFPMCPMRTAGLTSEHVFILAFVATKYSSALQENAGSRLISRQPVTGHQYCCADRFVHAQVWGSCVASANSPLALARHGLEQYLQLGVPADKMVLGLPW